MGYPVAGINNLIKLGATGMLFNGRISVSVASNAITVAIKTLDGSDPSPSNPVYGRINNQPITITYPLFVTRSSGTSWMEAGSGSFATRAIDYFVFLAWDSANSIVRIGFSRISFATVYSDFNPTTTHGKHGAFNTNPANSDAVIVIGRFEATLSASPNYYWSVPTFTSTNLIQGPIFETRDLVYLPTYSGNGSMTYTGSATGMYKLISNMCKLNIANTGTIGGTPNNKLQATLPMEANTYGLNVNAIHGSCWLGQGSYSLGGMFLDSTTIVAAGLSNFGNHSAGANGYWFGQIIYPI